MSSIKINDNLQNLINLLPNSSGCYLFYDKNLKLLYVGKALCLNKRVKQYFVTKNKSDRVKKMVSKIFTLETIITANEYEALVLEQNLIKQKKPIFNILLTDSKKYPYIQLKNYIHPRFEIVRSVNPKNGIYFGPIVQGQNVYTLVEILNIFYPFRKCRKLPKRKCIYLDLKMCLGPCINKIKITSYEPYIKEVRRIFRGDVEFLVTKIKKELDKAINKDNFLLAKKWKIFLDSLAIFSIQKPEFNDLDTHHVIARIKHKKWWCYLISFYLGGKWMGIQHFFIDSQNDPKQEIERFLLDFYNYTPKPYEVIINENYNFENLSKLLNIKIIFPKKGFKKVVLEKAIVNAKSAIKNHFPKWEKQQIKSIKGHKLLEKILNTEIYSIFMVDNSHHAYKFYVSGYVCFLNGKKKKEFYRYVDLTKESIKDDSQAIELSVLKMFKNYIKKESIFCDLLIVDGGIAQINAAKKAFRKLKLNIPIIGVSKDDHHKTSKLVISKEKSIKLVDNPLLYYLSDMQDEAHRFVNNYFQQKKEKQALLSTQEQIKNIGTISWNKLIKRFETIERIKHAPLDELCDLLGEKKAQYVFRFFNIKGETNE